MIPHHQHDWHKTNRRIPGATLKFHACKCKTIKVYDMEVVNKAEFKGRFEYEAK